MISSSSSKTTQTDASQSVASGGVLVTNSGAQGLVIADFRDENAVAAATELASQSVVTSQDVGLLALEIADKSKDQGTTIRLMIVAGAALGAAAIFAFGSKK